MNDMKDIITRLCDLEIERRMAKIEAQPVEQAEKQEKLCKYCGGMGRVVCNGRCMPEQEPVAWIKVWDEKEKKHVLMNYYITPPPKREIDMSTKPEKIDTSAERVHETDIFIHEDDDIQEYKRPWIGLTDEEVHKIIDDCTPDEAELEELNDFAKAIFAVEAKLRERNS